MKPPIDQSSLHNHSPSEKNIHEILGRDSVHPFPARMAPGLALDAIAESRTPLRILDPMSGSGTVLAVAGSRGHHAVGFDLDPLAVLISRVWTTATDAEAVRDAAATVLKQARRIFDSPETGNGYPGKADPETRRFIKYWFDEYTRLQLSSLASAIQRTPRDRAIREALWCAFSRLIITKQSGASLAMDLSHSRPHRRFKRAPANPFCRFPSAVDHVAANCIPAAHQSNGPPAAVHQGDARRLDIPDGTIDLTITSPPYLAAIDYLRCSKFSLVWMGYTIGELRSLRSRSVGTEVGLDAPPTRTFEESCRI